MKTMYDEVKEKLAESKLNGNKKEEKQYEEMLKTGAREILDIVLEYDQVDKIPTIDKKTIAFISYAEDGACGNSGEMYIITKSLNSIKHYCFNCLNETPIENFDQLLPWFTTFLVSFNKTFPDTKMFEIELEGWRHCYLGLGNHLFIREDIYPLFIDENIARIIDTHQHSKLLMCWKNKAEIILETIAKDKV